jgi:hypothetical protein
MRLELFSVAHSVIWQTLVEFLCRLTFGVAASMAVLPARWVTSGFFRVHLWVLMGVQTFAALAIWSLQGTERAGSAVSWQVGGAVVAAVVSYVGAVIWMYEAARAGKVALGIVAAAAFTTCIAPFVVAGSAAGAGAAVTMSPAVRALEVVSGGLVSGLVTTAMLLGHWYLNTPSMKLDPLKRLLVLLVAAIVVRGVISAIGAGMEGVRLSGEPGGIPSSWFLFLALRWIAGLVLPAGLTYLTWQTLKIPNTQSATGILYAGVILVFIGELCAQMLSAAARFPL